MKNLSIILIALLLFASCGRDETPVLEKSPEALQESGMGSSFEFKRGQDDLLESLYAEQAQKDPALKKLEDQLNQLHEQDSTKAFDEYNRKNKYYYEGAKQLTMKVTDSVLLKKMKALINASSAKYDNRVAGYKTILASIDTKTATIADLHALIKLTYTLPLIEQYQKDKLPPETPAKNYEAQLNSVLEYENSLLKK